MQFFWKLALPLQSDGSTRLLCIPANTKRGLASGKDGAGILMNDRL